MSPVVLRGPATAVRYSLAGDGPGLRAKAAVGEGREGNHPCGLLDAGMRRFDLQATVLMRLETLSVPGQPSIALDRELHPTWFVLHCSAAQHPRPTRHLGTGPGSSRCALHHLFFDWPDNFGPYHHFIAASKLHVFAVLYFQDFFRTSTGVSCGH